MQPTVRVREIRKSFGTLQAVDGVSFEVYPGEIFGLLGPNGAGKTTTIRMLMGILHPDAGQVEVLGQAPIQVRERVGYLPEERGLYPNLKVLDILTYLAQLKGRPKAWAQERAEALLARVGLAERAHAKVKELSRGMQQKVQLLAAIVHDPEVCVLDEPFQGLDPVNLQLVKELLLELKAAGKTIVLSTHQMNQVEALCSRIALINRGRVVLYGELARIQQTYAANVVYVHASSPLPELPMVRRYREHNGMYYLELPPEVSSQQLLRTLVQAGVEIQAFQVGRLPLEDIFVRVVQGEGQHAPS